MFLLLFWCFGVVWDEFWGLLWGGLIRNG